MVQSNYCHYRKTLYLVLETLYGLIKIVYKNICCLLYLKSCYLAKIKLTVCITVYNLQFFDNMSVKIV